MGNRNKPIFYHRLINMGDVLLSEKFWNVLKICLCAFDTFQQV